MKKPFENFYLRSLLIVIVLAVSLYFICGAFFETAGKPAPVKTVTPAAEQVVDDKELPEETEPADEEEEAEEEEEVKPAESAAPEKEKSDKKADDKSGSEKKDKEDTPKETKKPKKTGKPYYIMVNCQMNTVTVYARDEDGEFTVPVRAMVCSTGTATPRGTFDISRTGQWRWLEMQGGVYAQYVTQVRGNYLFHSVPYAKKDNSTLKSSAYDKLGTTCSAGCICPSTPKNCSARTGLCWTIHRMCSTI